MFCAWKGLCTGSQEIKCCGHLLRAEIGIDARPSSAQSYSLITYIYIYIERERERYTYMCIYIYIYTHIHTYGLILRASTHPPARLASSPSGFAKGRGTLPPCLQGVGCGGSLPVVPLLALGDLAAHEEKRPPRRPHLRWKRLKQPPAAADRCLPAPPCVRIPGKEVQARGL